MNERAEHGGHPSKQIAVETITLSKLYDDHGVPYYIKCDIEGSDEIFVEQLVRDPRRPGFVSIEAVSMEAVSGLRAAGYTRFQIVNQALHPWTKIQQPAFGAKSAGA